jgi:hypothetical protein
MATFENDDQVKQQQPQQQRTIKVTSTDVPNLSERAMWSSGNITVSTPVQCNSYGSYHISTTLVSSDKVLVCYSNVNNNDYLYAQILTISGTTITASTPVQCNSYSSYDISTTLVSSDKVLVCYRNGNNGYRYAQILTISGTTITASTPVQCNSNNFHYISTTLVSSDKVLVCYRNVSNNDRLYVQILTISGTTITASTLVQCNSYSSDFISTTLVSSDKVLVCYCNGSNNGYLYAQILTISGTTITASTPVQCNSYYSYYITTTLVSSDKVLVCYRNDSNNYYLYAQILTISGTTITVSTPVQCNGYNSDYITTTLVSSDKVLVCCRNVSNNYYLYAQILTISGTTITASTPVQCNSYSSDFISTTLVSSDKVLVYYRNSSNNGYLYAQILTISGTTITASTPVQCNSYNSYYITTTLVSSDKVLVCYRNNSNNSYLYAQIITG